MNDTSQHSKETTLTLLRQLHELASELDLVQLAEQGAASRIKALQEERFSLVVLGEFNHGKSTLINALLSAPLLPTGVTPTTVVLTEVRHAAEPTCQAIYPDGDVADMAPQELVQLMSEAAEQPSESAPVRAVVGYPSKLLAAGVTIVDTPGVNDLNELRAEVTYGYLPRADATLFVMDATQVLKRTERQFLTSRILRRSRDKVLFVLNKADLLNNWELKEAVRYAENQLATVVPHPEVYAVSAKLALSGDEAWRQSLQQLRQAFHSSFVVEKGRIMVDNAICDGLRLCERVAQSLELRRASAALEVQELLRKEAELQGRLEDHQGWLQQAMEQIDEQCDGLRTTMEQDLASFTAEFKQLLPDQLEEADSSDLRRFYSGYVQDVFRQWAEQEAEKVAAELEQIARRSASFAKGAANLEGQLPVGQPMERVELDVDTTTFDAVIVGLVTVGITVSVLVNLLAGGVMVAAAPLLASTFKNTVARETRRLAIERGLIAIDAAAERIRPQLQSFLEDFGGRLKDCLQTSVRGAFEEARDGLERIRIQKERGLFDEAQTVVGIDEQLTEVTELQQRFETLQQTLWAQSEAG